MYKMTTDWEGKLYIGITLEWNYTKLTVELSMKVYLETSLHEFQHPKPSHPQDSPYQWTAPIYGSNIQLTPPPDTTPTLLPEKCTWLQIVTGKFIYYCWSINLTMVVAIKTVLYTKPRAPKHSPNHSYIYWITVQPLPRPLLNSNPAVWYYISSSMPTI